MTKKTLEFYAEGEPQYGYGDASGYVDGAIEATPSGFLTNKTIELIDQFSMVNQPFFIMTSFWGFSSRLLIKPLRKFFMRSHSWGGSQSMKKQDPPPWGMKKVGSIKDFKVFKKVGSSNIP